MAVMRNILIYICMAVGVATTVTIVLPSTAAAQTRCDRQGTIITLKPWYYGLTEVVDGKCRVKSPGNTPEEQRRFTTRIVLTVIEDLLQIAAYVTVAFIIMGGFRYMTSSGAPDRAAKGMKTVLNAVIGLVVAMASIGLVNFIGGYLGL